MRTKRSLIISAVAVSLVLTGVTFSAHAEERKEEKKLGEPFGQMVQELAHMKNSLKVKNSGKELENIELKVGGDQQSAILQPNGTFRVTGAVVGAVDATAKTVTVTLYGFTRTVSIADAVIWGGGKTITIADINVGDKLAAVGTFDSTTRTIAVKEVRDVSYTTRASGDIQNQIEELKRKLKELQDQLRLLQH